VPKQVLAALEARWDPEWPTGTEPITDPDITEARPPTISRCCAATGRRQPAGLPETVPSAPAWTPLKKKPCAVLAARYGLLTCVKNGTCCPLNPRPSINWPCRCSLSCPRDAVSLGLLQGVRALSLTGRPCCVAAAPSTVAVRVTAAAPCAQVRAAPDAPPEIERQYRRMEWILYRLRRAHAQGGPAGPAAALASMGACYG